MTVTSGQSMAVRFTTCDSTGALADADSTPTGTLIQNGTALGTTVTVTNISTGDYKATWTHPSGTAADVFQLKIAATIGAISTADVVWGDYYGPANVNVAQVSGDSTAADNLELQYDGTGLTGDTFPATQGAVGNLTAGSAAINTTARDAPNGFVITTGTNETNNEDSTHALDGTLHTLDPSGGTTDAYYIFDVGSDGVPVSVTWQGYVASQGDTYRVYAYNWSGTAYEQVATLAAVNGTTIRTETFTLDTGHVGTGANVGLVRLRFQSTDGTKLATDRIICSYAIVRRTVGYADGAVWVDTNNGTAGTVSYVNGTADNPVSTWANALTIATALNLTRFRIIGGSSITLTGDSSNYALLGDGLFTLALGGQTIANAFIRHAIVSGTGAGDGAVFEDCSITASTSTGPAYFVRCGFNTPTGTPYAAASAGQYAFVDCVSQVAGSGTPFFTFAGTGSTTGVNFRRWSGGSNITGDSDVTTSMEVVTGGGQTFTTGGGNLEVRGICRAVTVTVAAAETVQVACVTGPITLNDDGASTATINLYGVSASVTDNTNGATVTDGTVSSANVDAILADTGTDGVVVAEMKAAALAQFATDDTGETVAASGSVAEIAQGSASLTADEVVAALSASGYAVVASSDAYSTEMTRRRGDTWSIVFTDLGDITGYADIWFTAKWSPDDADADALVMISESAGLVYSNGADAGDDAADGSITVDDEADGDITVALSAEQTALYANKKYTFDVQWEDSSGDIHTLAYGTLSVSADVSRTTGA